MQRLRDWPSARLYGRVYASWTGNSAAWKLIDLGVMIVIFGFWNH
jgi:hypothetical protein